MKLPANNRHKLPIIALRMKPRELIRQGELATLERMVAIRSAIHRAAVPQRKLVDQIKVIKDIILEKVVGPK